VPNWRKQEYDIWYRDPEVVVRNMLANPDFENEFEVAPYVELDVNGNRRHSDFMSANFAWRQCVCLFCQDSPLFKINEFLRISFMKKTPPIMMVACLFPSSLEVTRPL
jgi:Plavaka transposase